MTYFRKLWECLFYWRLPAATVQDMENAQVILTQGCGRDVNYPGHANDTLARVLLGLHEQYPELPMYPQEEVADSSLCEGLSFAGVVRQPSGLTKGRSTFDKWDTTTIVAEQAKFCHLRGYRRAIVVAAPFHQWRAVRVMEKNGLEPIIAPMPIGDHHYQNKNDHSRWFHQPWRWKLRELVARLMYTFGRRL